ncbi:CapA family protein [Burkholderia anthina]|uniref:CapA family protein n=1 Tax=Burkholderia anthina TaxID=179879 RepID=UPI001589E60F|nr:CapA family protein [Burkholderia anthina]
MRKATSGHGVSVPSCRIDDGFTFAVVGDLIGPGRPEMPLMRPGFMAVCELLKGADVTYANQEGSIFNIDAFAGYRAAENGGGYPLSSPEVAADILAMGIDVVSKANNHATDWGTAGLIATLAHLDAAGVRHCGAGESRAAARAPAYIETPKGRVAVLSAATTFTQMSEAGNADGETRSRPGISVIRTTRAIELPSAQFEEIRNIAGSLFRADPSAFDVHSEIQFQYAGDIYRMRSDDGPARLVYEPSALDIQEVRKSVRFARQTADFVAFTIHAHESESADYTDRRPPQFLRELLTQLIHDGVDLVAVTGPHELRGVEVVSGKPIFYGLGSFFLEMEGGRGPTADDARANNIDPLELTNGEYIYSRYKLPDDWYDSIAAVVEMASGVMNRIASVEFSVGDIVPVSP